MRVPKKTPPSNSTTYFALAEEQIQIRKVLFYGNVRK